MRLGPESCRAAGKSTDQLRQTFPIFHLCDFFFQAAAAAQKAEITLPPGSARRFRNHKSAEDRGLSSAGRPEECWEMTRSAAQPAALQRSLDRRRCTADGTRVRVRFNRDRGVRRVHREPRQPFDGRGALPSAGI